MNDWTKALEGVMGLVTDTAFREHFCSYDHPCNIDMKLSKECNSEFAFGWFYLLASIGSGIYTSA